MKFLLFFIFSSVYGFLSSPNDYLTTLKKNNPHKTYLETLENRRTYRKPLPNKNDNFFNQTSPFKLVNATFVINHIGAEQLLKKSNKEKKTSSSSGSFSIMNVDAYNFTSIGGYKNIKNELLQVLDMIMNPANYKKFNVRLPKGILLYGPPGNGKTLLAKCFAGESKLPIITSSGSEFQEKYVGTGSARIRELFEFARENLPCIIFIDELDAVARKRGADNEASTAERDSTLNQLLVELDGFNSFLDDKLFIISSTNRIDILDKALLRPGRIDKKIHVPNPDSNTRREILNIHLKDKPIQAEMDYLVNDITEGMSGADIEHLLNEATLESIRRNIFPITTDDLERMKESILIGGDYQETVLSDDVAYKVAIHETGHALVSILCHNHDNPKKITIRSTNKMLGYTLFPHPNVTLNTISALEDKLKVLLAGRAAEEIVFGLEQITTGASDDLEKCHKLAHDMILVYGMGKSLLYSRMSDQSKKEIDDAVLQLIDKSYDEAKNMLMNNIHILKEIASELILKTSLDIDEINQLVNNIKNVK